MKVRGFFQGLSWRSWWPRRGAAKAALLVLAFFGLSAADPEMDFVEGTAPFVLRAQDEVIPYRVFGLYVLPGEEVDLEAIAPDDRRFVLRAPAGAFTRPGRNRWLWTAPDIPGLYRLEIVHPVTVSTITLNVFVTVPLSRVQGGTLHGYRIDDYPAQPLNGLEVYNPPDGLIEVQPWYEDVPVSPHFTLGQFLCKQAGGYPKYLVLDERLLRKLEVLLQKLNENGIPANGFHVMSGFRTPFYNRAIGNTTTYSIHQWGGAADIFVDENGDSMMDDVNRDGRITKEDALFLYRFVDEMQDDLWFKPYIGGLGAYNSTSAHGPYIHVDTRGFVAHWGA
ncbi:MAG TPA: hypothetical protein VF756_27610 [Thermoanaerobaculia bacterium]